MVTWVVCCALFPVCADRVGLLEVETLIAQEAGDYVRKFDLGQPTDPALEMSKSLEAAKRVASTSVAPTSEGRQ